MLPGQIPYVLQVTRGMDYHACRALDQRLNNKTAGLFGMLFYVFFTGKGCR